MKYWHASLAALSILAGCGTLPPTPRVQASTPVAPTTGVLVVRVIGPLLVLPLGFHLPLSARRLDLVLTDASGQQLTHQIVPVTLGGTFMDATLNAPAGAGQAVAASVADDAGRVLAAGRIERITVGAGQVTSTAVVLQPPQLPM